MEEPQALRQPYVDLNMQIFNMKKLLTLLLLSPLAFAEDEYTIELT